MAAIKHHSLLSIVWSLIMKVISYDNLKWNSQYQMNEVHLKMNYDLWSMIKSKAIWMLISKTIFDWNYPLSIDLEHYVVSYQLPSYEKGLQHLVGAKTYIWQQQQKKKLLMEKEKDMSKIPLVSFRSNFFFLFGLLTCTHTIDTLNEIGYFGR